MDSPNKDHLAVLKKYFGHSEFRPKQWEIIKCVLQKQDTCVVMATGYGKSLCYQFPPVYQNKLAIVVSPLISLMEDQIKGLEMCNITACQLGSSQSDKRGAMEGALRGDYRVIYATPEWCSGQYSHDFLRELNNKSAITLVAIDEAHCISQWGFDFRSSYRHLGKLRELLPNVPFMAVTATATPQVRNDICLSLKLRSSKIICTSFDRPNLYLSASLKGKDILSDIKPLLNKVKLMNGLTKGSTIIYCPTKKGADKVAEQLNAGGIRGALYHADLSLKLRKEVHENFVKDINPIIVATVAFGMGIDKPDVRLVVHYGAPKDLESFYQEIGRAGRDGHQSYCHAFYCNGDFQLSEYFFQNLSGKFLEHKRKLAATLQYYLQTRECRRQILLSHFDPTGEFTSVNNCCDNCSRGKRTGPHCDLTSDALLLLEAVQALNGKFGLSASIFLLRGSENKRLPKSYYNDKLYGAGNGKSEMWWKCLGKLLQREGLLKSIVPVYARNKQNNFPGYCISLSNEGEKYLNEKGGIHLEPTEEMMGMVRNVLPRTSGWVEASSGISMLTSEETCEVVEPKERKIRDNIFNGLMRLRSELSKKLNCMPYMIASLKTLQDLSITRPTTLESLSTVEGMTEAKVNNCGQIFLNCISEHLKEGEPVKKYNKAESSPKCVQIDTDNWYSVEQFKKVGHESETAKITESESTLNLEMDSEDDELFSNLENVVAAGIASNTFRNKPSESLMQDGSNEDLEFQDNRSSDITGEHIQGSEHISSQLPNSFERNKQHSCGNARLPTLNKQESSTNNKRRLEYLTDSDSDDTTNQTKHFIRKYVPRKKATEPKLSFL